MSGYGWFFSTIQGLQRDTGGRGYRDLEAAEKKIPFNPDIWAFSKTQNQPFLPIEFTLTLILSSQKFLKRCLVLNPDFKEVNYLEYYNMIAGKKKPKNINFVIHPWSYAFYTLYEISLGKKIDLEPFGLLGHIALSFAFQSQPSERPKFHRIEMERKMSMVELFVKHELSLEETYWEIIMKGITKEAPQKFEEIPFWKLRYFKKTKFGLIQFDTTSWQPDGILFPMMSLQKNALSYLDPNALAALQQTCDFYHLNMRFISLSFNGEMPGIGFATFKHLTRRQMSIRIDDMFGPEVFHVSYRFVTLPEPLFDGDFELNLNLSKDGPIAYTVRGISFDRLIPADVPIETVHSLDLEFDEPDEDILNCAHYVMEEIKRVMESDVLTDEEEQQSLLLCQRVDAITMMGNTVIDIPVERLITLTKSEGTSWILTTYNVRILINELTPKILKYFNHLFVREVFLEIVNDTHYVD
ncbi:hypothetical protein SNEBB_009285 [Seison nebaliae]|nr:hypothetical protein SNEBB_009285 [Seison nebaliae]